MRSSTNTDDDGSEFETSVEALAAAGITRGCNPPTNDLFCPDDALTRAQMAAFLTRAYGYQAEEMDRSIDDNRLAFETAIEALAAAVVTKGCNPPRNDQFCPHANVTRGEMAAFLHRTG
jgi:hypothetical protein